MSNVPTDNFQVTFHNWLLSKGWKDGDPFFRNSRGWFVLVQMKKIYLPDLFSEYSNLLHINSETPK